jgi:hypothetical protein
MRRLPVPVLVSAAIVLMLIMSGCTGKLPAPPAESALDSLVATAPVTTTAQVPVMTLRAFPSPSASPLPDADADQAFVDAAEVCYNKTPVISDLATHMAFVTCMMKTPVPAGACARNYRYYALKYTNDDDTTSGFARETHNTHLAREAFSKNLAYDAPSQQFVPCSGAL